MHMSERLSGMRVRQGGRCKKGNEKTDSTFGRRDRDKPEGKERQAQSAREAVTPIDTDRTHFERDTTMDSRAQRIKADRVKADRRSAVRILTVIMIGIFVLVGMRSYAAIIQHENNVLERENEYLQAEYLQAEIDSLQSQIIDETRVTRIEKVATQQFGMVYPSAANVVKLGNAESEVKNLAAAIRSEAYN